MNKLNRKNAIFRFYSPVFSKHILSKARNLFPKFGRSNKFYFIFNAINKLQYKYLLIYVQTLSRP